MKVVNTAKIRAATFFARELTELASYFFETKRFCVPHFGNENQKCPPVVDLSIETDFRLGRVRYLSGGKIGDHFLN